MAFDDIAFFEVWVIAFDDLRDPSVADGLVELEGGRVGFDGSGAHPAAHVGVEGDDMVFEDYAIFGNGGEVQGTGFEDKVFAGFGEAAGDRFEDYSFVLDHYDEYWSSVWRGV